jgi:phytoene desaturase
MIIVFCGHLHPKNESQWEPLKNQARTGVLKRLAQIGIPDLSQDIIQEQVFTPLDWQSTLNLSKGSVFGSLAHNLGQSGYYRPHNRHKRYSNLYFVGGGTHPGSGLPMVLISAQLTAARICSEAGIQTNLTL